MKWILGARMAGRCWRLLITVVMCNTALSTWRVHGTEPWKAVVKSDNRVDKPVLDLDVAKSGDLLLVPVSIGGLNVNFAVDTGAAVSFVNRDLVRKLPPMRRSERVYPGDYPPIFELPEASIAGTNISVTCDAASADLSTMWPAGGYEFQGILGMNILKDYVLQIDSDRGKLRLFNHAPHRLRGGLKLSLDEHHRPTLGVELFPNQITPMLVDTGMIAPGIGELKREVFDALLAEDRLVIKGPPAAVGAVDGKIAGQKAILDRFRVGRFEHTNIGARSGTLNAIGMDYLSRYLVTLDFPNGVIYLEEGERYAETTGFDASGIVLLKLDGRIIVSKVHPKGPAYPAGIRSGDQIMEIDSTKVEDMTLFSLRRLLTRKDHRVQIAYRRGEQASECVLLLTDWQPIAAKELNPVR